MKIPIVDESDEIINYKERNNLNSKDIYRVTGLWVTDKKGNILLAQRAFNKRHDPGKWEPAVAGTVEEGETYESNIIKETEEEIGLKNIKPILGPKLRIGNYFAQEFLLNLPVGFDNFKISNREVKEVKWFSKIELKNELKKNPKNFLMYIHVKVNNKKYNV